MESFRFFVIKRRFFNELLFLNDLPQASKLELLSHTCLLVPAALLSSSFVLFIFIPSMNEQLHVLTAAISYSITMQLVVSLAKIGSKGGHLICYIIQTV